MKCILFLSMVVAVAVAQSDGIPSDPITLKSYADCFVGSGVCIGTAGTLKKYAFNTYDVPCKDCNGEQKQQVKVFLARFKDQAPEDYKKFQSSYDPDAKYLPALIDAVSRL